MNIPEDLKYSPTHQWTRLDDGLARVGITEFAAGELGEIIFLELPSFGDAVTRAKPMGIIESLKAVDDLYSPITGEITDVNSGLLRNLDAIVDDPYGQGWMVVIDPDDRSELDHLMSAAEYRNYIQKDT